MKTKTKDEKIIRDSIENETPIFVFSAKDKFSIDILHFYIALCEAGNCNRSHIKGIIERIIEFSDYKVLNMDKVKLPD